MNDIMKLYNKQRDESYWFQEAWEKCFWILSKVIDHKIITLDEYSPPIKITYNKNINRIYIHQNKTISEKGIDINIPRELEHVEPFSTATPCFISEEQKNAQFILDNYMEIYLKAKKPIIEISDEDFEESDFYIDKYRSIDDELSTLLLQVFPVKKS